MPDINNLHSKEDYVAAISEERFTDYVAQRNANAVLWRRRYAVLLACLFICVVATLALSYN